MSSKKITQHSPLKMLAKLSSIAGVCASFALTNCSILNDAKEIVVGVDPHFNNFTENVSLARQMSKRRGKDSIVVEKMVDHILAQVVGEGKDPASAMTHFHIVECQEILKTNPQIKAYVQANVAQKEEIYQHAYAMLENWGCLAKHTSKNDFVKVLRAQREDGEKFASIPYISSSLPAVVEQGIAAQNVSIASGVLFTKKQEKESSKFYERDSLKKVYQENYTILNVNGY